MSGKATKNLSALLKAMGRSSVSCEANSKARKQNEPLMIWTLVVECICGNYLEEECVRTIEVESKSSLYDLHSTIQGAVGFGQDHLFEFHAGRNYRNRKVVFDDLYDMAEGNDNYDFITLEQVYPLPKSCKLYYHFDFGDDWYFEIRKGRQKPQEPVTGVHYPRVVKSIGPNPSQYGDFDE